jgi:hypothetical protein
MKKKFGKRKYRQNTCLAFGRKDTSRLTKRGTGDKNVKRKLAFVA